MSRPRLNVEANELPQPLRFRASWVDLPVDRSCHAECTIGPNADHHGTMSYRCMGGHGESLPFPGEAFTTHDMGDHLMYIFDEDE